jgi:Mn-dependent DtxR family transcriptional regulator
LFAENQGDVAMNDDMPWVNLTQEEVEELRNKKHELTEYGKQKLRELMNKDLIFYTNGKETSRIPSPTLETLTLGTKTPETKLEIKMTEPIEAKVSEEDFNKIVDAFNNPQPYPDEMFEEAERREAANRELAKEEWERKERSDTVLARYNRFYNDECSGLPHGTPITPEHMQALTLECMVDALICENMNVEYNVIAINDIKDLIARLYQQGNEYLKRVQEFKDSADGVV